MGKQIHVARGAETSRGLWFDTELVHRPIVPHGQQFRIHENLVREVQLQAGFGHLLDRTEIRDDLHFCPEEYSRQLEVHLSYGQDAHLSVSFGELIQISGRRL